LPKEARKFEKKKVYVIESKEETGKAAKDMFKTYVDAAKLKLKISSFKVGRNGKAILIADDDQQLEKIQAELDSTNCKAITIRDVRQPDFRVCVKRIELEKKTITSK
jgi:hypothetical protein